MPPKSQPLVTGNWLPKSAPGGKQGTQLDFWWAHRRLVCIQKLLHPQAFSHTIIFIHPTFRCRHTHTQGFEHTIFDTKQLLDTEAFIERHFCPRTFHDRRLDTLKKGWSTFFCIERAFLGYIPLWTNLKTMTPNTWWWIGTSTKSVRPGVPSFVPCLFLHQRSISTEVGKCSEVTFISNHQPKHL
jgi:hypothetical protein